MNALIKILVASLFALASAAGFAAAEVNKASQAELEAMKHIGPALAGRIVDERKKAPYKDWNDLVDRVKGIGAGNAGKFSAEGLTVNGAPYRAGTPVAMAGKADKPAGKMAEKPADKPAEKPSDKPAAKTGK